MRRYLQRIRWHPERRRDVIDRVLNVFMFLVLLGMLVILCFSMSGCTAHSTTLVLEQYETSEKHKQVAFDNVYKSALQFMYMAVSQHIKSTGQATNELDPTLKAVFVARQQLEDMKIQYERGRALSAMTVGTYLYDQVGWLNAMIESKANRLERASEGMGKANDAAGTDSFWDLIPAGVRERIHQPSEPDSTLEDMLNDF